MTIYANPIIEAALTRSDAVGIVDSITVERTVVAPVPAAVTCTPIARRTDLLSGQQAWSWDQLRDYVVAEIIKVCGPIQRDPIKESGIFKGFVKRHGANARPIAEAAFTAYRGYWRQAPINVTRFTEGNDTFFALPILEKLQELKG